MMPSNIPGIDYVINKSDIMGGAEVEGDEALRSRAKRAMERAGKATIRALQLAVQSVEGVTGEVVVIDQPDGVPGIIQVIATGGDRAEVEKIIDETRSAGIRVEFKRPISVSIDVRLMVYTMSAADKEAVRQSVDVAVRKYMASLEIGDDVVISRIIESAMSVSGVRDVREVTVNDKPENIKIKRDEKGDCRLLEIFMEA
jgi:phage-related baseplate assembly protein